MATAGGVVSRSACQGLLRTVARPHARSRLLVRKPRWISSEGPARPEQLSSLHNKLPRDRRKPFRTVSQQSFEACKAPVGLVGSEIECLCSWNEASGSRQAIYVPGDASRPRKTPLSALDAATHAPLPSAWLSRPWGYCNPGRGPRAALWDDALAALCATDPELKLDHVDVMISGDVLLHLLIVAQDGDAPFFGTPIKDPSSMAFDMLLIGKTLVIRRRHRSKSFSDIRVPTGMPRSNWEYYKVATETVPRVEDSSIHYQLLRYKIGPLSCVVKVEIHGTVQDMPTSTLPSEPPRAHTLHRLDVVKAGRGVDPAFAFQAIARPFDTHSSSDSRRLKTLTARVWFSGQTRLGVANVVPAGRVGELGGLTVVDMADLVRHYEEQNQTGLRRLVGLLGRLRRAVYAHGAPCVGTIVPPSDTAGEQNYAIELYRAGPDERRQAVLLEWHRKHFWSQDKVHKKKQQPRGTNAQGQSQPQGTPDAGHVDEPKSFIRKWAQWLGF